MDSKLIDILQKSNKPHSFIERLPISQYRKINDSISTELFGVLYDLHLDSITQQSIVDFLIQNITTHNISLQHLEKLLNYELHWQMIIKKILSNPGLITEYFVVDNLKRNILKPGHSNKIIKNTTLIGHSKASPELDEVSKIDFLSHIQNDRCFYNIGIQLTTQTQHQYSYSTTLNAGEGFRNTASNKKQKISDLSHNITENDKINIPIEYQKYIPDMLGYMVINGGIDKILNIEKYNFFAVAFNKWQLEGFPIGGPSKHIRKDLLTLLHNIGRYYQISLLLCQNFIINNLLTENTRFQKRIFDKEDIKYIETYKPQVNELLYEFFMGDFSSGETTLLFSISYFVGDHMMKLMKK